MEFIKQNKKHSIFQPNGKLIKIGRMPDCDILIDNKSLSRYQCVLYHRETGWVIVDGDGTQPSKNGTWYDVLFLGKLLKSEQKKPKRLFADELFLIYDGMVFKAGKTLFQANVIHPKKSKK